MKYFTFLTLFVITLSVNIYGQTIPSDFKLEITARGASQWESSATLTISADGQSEFVEIQGVPPHVFLDTTFVLNSSSVLQIWQAVQDNNFFSIDSNSIVDSVYGGSIALLKVTANGITNQVIIKNAQQQQIQNIIDTINTNIPAKFNLDYSPPEKVDVVPTDPCDQFYWFKLSKKSLSTKLFNKMKLNYNAITSVNNVVQIPHGGVEVGYQMSLQKAVSTGHATLKSKGDYFGDAVSITGDNTKNFPPSDNTINIKLNLEFYGPCASKANEAKVTKDIYDKWNGRTTSGGKKLKIGFKVISDSGVTSPPGTPGFDDIKLECGKGRSYVWGLGDPNTDKTNNATWYMGSASPGVFGHEAGHLMGLDDEYQDWDQQKDGSWKNAKTSKVLSYTDFVNYYNSIYPEDTYATNKYIVDHCKIISLPLPGHKNDLMFDETKPPTQSEIDNIAANAGLIIHIKAGDILSNKNNDEQNLLVTRSGDLFLNPGQVKTLNGIYTACIDAYKEAPTDSVVFDVAPSLDKWTGIPSAQDMLKLAKFIDSLRYYCGYYFDSQAAVWRISDNVSISTSSDTLFQQAGINLGKNILHFPKLVNHSNNDSVSGSYIPPQLFVPEIQPKSAQAKIGDKLSFNVNISQPIDSGYSTNYSWLLTAPGGSSSQISPNGSFVTDKTGFYSVSVKINITGNDTSSYTPDLASYAVVPDNFTETFEHSNLTDKFNWKTYGDTKWHITNSDAETGKYSASSGEVLYNQTSTIEIYVNLPKDSSITFAIKLLSNEGSDLEFDVDSNYFDSWNNSMDWHFYSYPLNAGKHLLSWQLSNPFGGPSEAWIDNIFFPDNSFVTKTNRNKSIPLKFNLFQNYPNPFNPSTEIKFTIPKSGNVKLIIYNTLGQKVRELINNYMAAGEYHINFNAGKLTSGIYFYKLTTASHSAVKKMILIK